MELVPTVSVLQEWGGIIPIEYNTMQYNIVRNRFHSVGYLWWHNYKNILSAEDAQIGKSYKQEKQCREYT